MVITTRVLVSLMLALCFSSISSGLQTGIDTDEQNEILQQQLTLAGDNKVELVKAIQSAPDDQRAAVEFLVMNMPSNDLRSLSAEFLLSTVRVAFEARAAAPWADEISDELFLNDILPYANVDETREDWRAELRAICLPIVKDCQTAGEAAQELNKQLFREVGVKYSTKRKKANQSPSESIDTGLASCTGLSILLTDACRSVHVPARLTGIPSWTNKRGNHTWVEVWDNADRDWHFTGAAEYNAKGLDRAWFTRDAALADKSKRMNSIYSVSFGRTDTIFPIIWSRDPGDRVYGVNVTDRYTPTDEPDTDPEKIRVRIRIWNADRTERVATTVRLVDPANEKKENADETLFGTSPSNTADMNDMLEFAVQRETDFQLHIALGDEVKIHKFTTTAGDTQLIEVSLDDTPAANPLQQEANGEQETDAQQEDEHGEHKHTNRLIDETSPYLLQHAHNPVQWYPWGDEALEKAKKENKLIFLSIGYSSCHWCHVMEHESFLDEEIAKFLNDNFVCIKVDREERPDVDAIYMQSLQIVNELSQSGRGGGWPLSMFMLPDTKPFFGGTYFPARAGDRGARIGFEGILKRIDKVWTDSPSDFERDAKLITRLTRKSLYDPDVEVPTVIKPTWTTDALSELNDRFDPEWGGFGFNPGNANIPKFPEESKLLWLVDVVRRNPKNEQARQIMIRTGDRMMMGGIHDHVGGGFHRYSVDRFWRIPHYEKMLYNNGQLTSFYAELYKLTDNPAYKRVVEEMLTFVEREMLASEGGYYAALDADSEGEEGKYYVWDRAEIQELLTDSEYDLYAAVFGINGPPNFEGKHYSPILSQDWQQTAAARGMTLEKLWAELKPINQKLFDYRQKRVRPGTDTKVLTSWNGLMIRGLADAGRLLEEPKYIARAEAAAEFVLNNLLRDDGKLWRTYTAGEAKLNGYLDDYAFLIDGMLAIHKATGNEKWLKHADQLQLKQNELFLDPQRGGYFFTSNDHPELLARTKDPVDSAIPSGNGVSAANLLYLARELKKPEYKQIARGVVYSTGGLLDRVPYATARLLESIPDLAE